MALANTIRQLRFHHGEITQKDLAEYVGVSRQTICTIEGGKYLPSLEVAFRIANILCTPLENVFSYDPDIEGDDELPPKVIIHMTVDAGEPIDGNS